MLTSYAGLALAWPALLAGCGGGGGGSSNPVGATPPAPTPAPTPMPSPSPAPAPAPATLTIAFAGSSSPEQYLTLFAGPATSDTVLASSDGIAFSPLATGAFGKAAGRQIATATGRPVRFVRGGVSGSTLAEWVASGSGARAALVQRIRAAGGVDALLLQVGGNDAILRTIVSVDAQAAALNALIASIRSETGLPGLTVFLGAAQDYPSGDASQHAQLALQRQAELAVAASGSNVRYGFCTYDLATSDGLHQNEASQLTSGARFASQVIAWLQGLAERRGSRPISARAIDDRTTEVTIAHVGGTDFTPDDGITGFHVTAGGAVCPISAARRTSATTIRLTHASASGGTRAVYHALFADGGAASVHDNSALQLPLEPSRGALPLTA